MKKNTYMIMFDAVFLVLMRCMAYILSHHIKLDMLYYMPPGRFTIYIVSKFLRSAAFEERTVGFFLIGVAWDVPIQLSILLINGYFFEYCLFLVINFHVKTYKYFLFLEIRASALLVPEGVDLQNDREKYLFSYSIRMSLQPQGCVINGMSHSSCQLYWRHWIIRANDAVVSDVNGEAVIGMV